MDSPIHIAITRRVRKDCVGDYERALGEFARRSLLEHGARGVHYIFPPPGSDSTEYGVLRTFASAEDRDAFYKSPLYKEWVAQIAPWVVGESKCRELRGLEAWFREPSLPMPPDWKMALLTWVAVWPVSIFVPAVLNPLLGPKFNFYIGAGIIAAGIVVILTWVAMPLLVKITHRWLYPPTL
jgi:antibiotic biosynthesis monooxygenase (ABM) superfamily enzyme